MTEPDNRGMHNTKTSPGMQLPADGGDVPFVYEDEMVYPFVQPTFSLSQVFAEERFHKDVFVIYQAFLCQQFSMWYFGAWSRIL